VFAAGVGLIAPDRVRALATAALGLGLGLFLTGPLDDVGLRVGVVALVTASTVALERGLARLSAQVDPRGAALAHIVLVSGAALAILFSDTASLAQATGGLAVGLGALFALGLLWPRAAVLTRAAPVVAIILAANLWGTTLYANGHPAVLAALTLAPLLVSLLPLATPRRVLLRIAIPATLLGIPIAAATAWAGARYFAPSDSDAPTSKAPASAADPAAPATAADPAAPAKPAYDPDYGY